MTGDCIPHLAAGSSQDGTYQITDGAEGIAVFFVRALLAKKHVKLVA